MRLLIGSLVAALALSSCKEKKESASPERPASAPAAATTEPEEYRAEILFTDYGVPHIVADDLGSVLFGQGYAAARAHVCVIADQWVRIRGERARYHGPGPEGRYVDSDFGYRAIDFPGRARRAWNSVSADTQMIFRAWAAGYNQYLEEVGRERLPLPCRGAEWVVPLSPEDALAYVMDLNVVGTSGRFIRAIGAAQPEKKGAFDLPLAPRTPPASNGWGLGAEATVHGRGMLVANPHYPWEGAHTFYESHLVIPGKLNVYGATLVGAPLINIGFNDSIAWTHTVSNSRRILLYRMTLAPGDSTAYVTEGEERKMERQEYSIDVRTEEGELENRTRTLYRTHLGPVIVTGSLPWGSGQAFVLHDVAIGISTAADQYLAMMRSRDLKSFRQAFASFHATPFVNTMYADRAGNALYIDGSSAPSLSAAGLAAWRIARKTVPAVARAWRSKVIGLDGSRSLFAPYSDPDAVHPGVLPVASAPTLLRRDFVANANGSYWATNPHQLLTEFHPFYGDVATEQSARTRMNLALLTERGEGAAAGADGRFTLEELEEAILSNRSFSAELLREEVVSRCRQDKKLVPLCSVLAAWDGRLDVDRKGAALWREVISGLDEVGLDSLYAESFDAARPVATPRGLKKGSEANAAVTQVIRTAAQRLRAAGFDPVKVTLGELQYTRKASKRFPVHGGKPLDGTTNLAQYRPGRSLGTYPELDGGEFVHRRTGLTRSGYPINYGTSFIMVMEFGEEGPRARALVTYSGSSDPASPHFADQTELWAQKRLRDVRFTLEDVRAHAKSRKTVRAKR